MTPEQQIKALGVFLQDQFAAVTADAMRQMDFQFGIASNDPFDLKYLHRERGGHPCLYFQGCYCSVNNEVPCSICPEWIKYYGIS